MYIKDSSFKTPWVLKKPQSSTRLKGLKALNIEPVLGRFILEP